MLAKTVDGETTAFSYDSTVWQDRLIAVNGVAIRKREKHIFIMNFTDEEKHITLDREYTNALTNEINTGDIVINADECLILK